MSAPTIVLDSVVFEIRYAFGYLFYDRSGQIISDIERNLDGWIFVGADSNMAKLENPFHNFTALVGLERFAFICNKAEASHSGDITAEIKAFWKIVQANLAVNDFHRIGTRIKYIAPFMSIEEAEKITASDKIKIGLFQPIEDDGFTPTIREIIQIFKHEDTKFRVQIQAVTRANAVAPSPIMTTPLNSFARHHRNIYKERNRQLAEYNANPTYCIELDVDCYQLDPEEINITQFVKENRGLVEDKFLPIFRSLL